MTLTPAQQAQWDAVRESVASALLRMLTENLSAQESVDLLLAIPELAVLDSNQTMPPAYTAIEHSQIGMDNLIKAGWARVLPRLEEVKP